MDQIIKTTIKISLLSLSIMMFLTAILFSCDNKSIDLGSHFIYDTEHQYISGHQIGILYPLIIKHQPNINFITDNLEENINRGGHGSSGIN